MRYKECEPADLKLGLKSEIKIKCTITLFSLMKKQVNRNLHFLTMNIMTIINFIRNGDARCFPKIIGLQIVACSWRARS